MCKRGQLLGGIVADGPDLLAFEYFLSCEKIVKEYTMKHCLSEVKAHNERRRKLLKEEDQDGYDWEIFN